MEHNLSDTYLHKINNNYKYLPSPRYDLYRYCSLLVVLNTSRYTSTQNKIMLHIFHNLLCPFSTWLITPIHTIETTNKICFTLFIRRPTTGYCRHVTYEAVWIRDVCKQVELHKAKPKPRQGQGQGWACCKSRTLGPGLVSKSTYTWRTFQLL